MKGRKMKIESISFSIDEPSFFLERLADDLANLNLRGFDGSRSHVTITPKIKVTFEAPNAA